MSGYIVKINLENTHPPVWRRMIIPERITFGNLHDMLQIVFGWEDAHLHDFSFSADSDRVGTDISYGDLPEKKTIVDEYLLDNKWIRYTYDFGDSWEHKIVLEKIDDTYQERYAAVLKYKGDNFEEDSGGVWSMYDDYDAESCDEDEEDWRHNRPMFVMDEVNKKLAAYKCAKAKGNTKRATGNKTDVLQDIFNEMQQEIGAADKNLTPQQKKIMKSILAMGQNIGNSVNVNKIISDMKVPQNSKTSDMVEKWHQFYDHLIKQPDNIVPFSNSKSKTQYKQMTLFEEPLDYQSENQVESYCVQKAKSGHTWQQMLGKLNDAQIKDYSKYLGLSQKDRYKKADAVKAIQQELLNHPEYILYILDCLETEKLLEWSQMDDGVMDEKPDVNAVSKWISLGLAEVDIVKNGKQHVAYIQPAKDIAPLLEKIAALNRDQEYEWLEKNMMEIHNIVKVYGMIEFSECERICRKRYQTKLSTTEFERLIYWHGRMCEIVQTCTSPEGVRYVASLDTDVVHTKLTRDELAADIAYREYTAEDWKYIEEGNGTATPYWYCLLGILKDVTTLSEDDIGDKVEEWNWRIQNGDTLDAMADELADMLDDYNSLSLWAAAYFCMLNIIMYTNITVLKGHSRYSLWQKYQKPLSYLSFFQKEYLLESIGEIDADTGLEQMPETLQIEIFKAINKRELSKTIHELDRILDELEETNVELQFLRLQFLMESKEFDRAEKELLSLKKYLEAKDKVLYEEEIMEINECMQEIRTEKKSQGNGTVVRMEKKIGRNDPCPCGSGKKYKKCCGKNES